MLWRWSCGCHFCFCVCFFLNLDIDRLIKIDRRSVKLILGTSYSLSVLNKQDGTDLELRAVNVK